MCGSILASLRKYFCACVRICTTVRVGISSAMRFHCFPYLRSPSSKSWCSSVVHRPVLPPSSSSCPARFGRAMLLLLLWLWMLMLMLLLRRRPGSRNKARGYVRVLRCCCCCWPAAVKRRASRPSWLTDEVVPVPQRLRPAGRSARAASPSVYLQSREAEVPPSFLAAPLLFDVGVERGTGMV